MGPSSYYRHDDTSTETRIVRSLKSRRNPCQVRLSGSADRKILKVGRQTSIGTRHGLK